jgi:thiol:disulfide interchange protein
MVLRVRLAAPGLVCAALLAGAPRAFAQTPVRFAVALGRDAPVPGAILHVAVAAEIDAGWHLYALTEPSGGPVPLAMAVAPGGPFALAGSIGAPPVTRALDRNFNIETEFYEDHASFDLPVRIRPGTTPGAHDLRVALSFQTCNDRLCLPPTEETLSVSVMVKGAATPVLPTSPVPSPSPVTTARPQGVATRPLPGRVPDLALASASAGTLEAYVGLAALMGALSLLTPCVFPMVPITVSYFSARGGRSRRESVGLALAYGVGIVLTFTGIGVVLAVAFGASGLNRFAADPWLNLGVTALFVAFALSLFGIVEPALPSRLVNAAARADRGVGRYAGTLLMGLAFTLTSFTCTAPFLGTLFVVAAQGQWLWPLAGMLAFSSVFALPFVVLAVAPQLLASLPRSGAWLQSVKASMGVLELAAAVKFLSNVDLVWGWGVVTRSVVLWIWIAMSLLLACYFAGVVKIGRAPRLARPGPARSAIAAAAAVLAVWLLSGLSGRSVGEIEAFLPPADAGGSQAAGELRWIVNDYRGALDEAQKLDRPVLIDFTGYTCTNCRWMEANMFPRPDVARELAHYIRVRLYTDGRGELYGSFQKMQQQVFGTVALPYYAALAPDGRPRVAFGGLTRNPGEYIAFLQRGLE